MIQWRKMISSVTTAWCRSSDSEQDTILQFGSIGAQREGKNRAAVHFYGFQRALRTAVINLHADDCSFGAESWEYFRSLGVVSAFHFQVCTRILQISICWELSLLWTFWAALKGSASYIHTDYVLDKWDNTFLSPFEYWWTGTICKWEKPNI